MEDDEYSMLMNLPSEITIDILSRLSARTIARCKCICKSWFQLLETRYFVKLHLSKSVPGLIIVYYHDYLSNQEHDDILRVFEFKDDKLDLEALKPEPEPEPELEQQQQHVEINCTTLGSLGISMYIVGSAHGFLFIQDDGGLPSDRLYICNPITREYINVPNPEGGTNNNALFKYGFGVSKISDQCKVVRISKTECDVYTLGTGSWRSVPLDPFHANGYRSVRGGVFINGNIHWLVWDLTGSFVLISCFDLETELFKAISPPSDLDQGDFDFSHLVVLGDRLCWCEQSTSNNQVVIWIMKEYGVEKSWTRECVISQLLPYVEYTVCAYPVHVFKDGDILLWKKFAFYYYSKNAKTISNVDRMFLPRDSAHIETRLYVSRLHVSSFLSLKSFGVLENVVKF